MQNSPMPNPKSWLAKSFPHLLILFILVLISYINSLNNAFLSDDLAEIVRNPNVGNFSNVTSHPFGFIRPLLYFLAYHIGGLNQFIFRSINIFFHTGSVFLVYAIFHFLFPKRVSLILAAIFAVHPGISEAVVWISGGMYPQYAFFFLLSFLFYLLSKNKQSLGSSDLNKKYYLISIFSFLFAFMSHPQMPLALFLVFPLWELCFGNLKNNWKKTLPYLGISLAYVLVALSSLPERETTLKSMHYQEGGVDNPFVLIPIAVTSYFELTFFPKALTLYHSELAFHPLNFMLRAIFTIFFFALAIFGLFKKRILLFGSAFFLLSLAPTLTPFRLTWVVAERYLYLSIFGLLVLVGFGLNKLFGYSKLKAISYTVVVIVLLIFSVRTIIRNIDWANEDNLWIATGKTSPSSPNNHNNLGDVYGRRGDKEAAIREFQTAIALKPNYGDAYHNLANVYREMGQYDTALENYQKALEFNPNLWQSYQNIAAIHFDFGRQQATASGEEAAKNFNLALQNMEKAISINSQEVSLYNNLALVYLVAGNKEKAKEIFTMILSADPQNQFAQQGLAEASK